MCVSDGEEVHLESNMHQAVISEIEGGRWPAYPDYWLAVADIHGIAYQSSRLLLRGNPVVVKSTCKSGERAEG